LVRTIVEADFREAFDKRHQGQRSIVFPCGLAAPEQIVMGNDTRCNLLDVRRNLRRLRYVELRLRAMNLEVLSSDENQSGLGGAEVIKTRCQPIMRL
jgi:hypothetical protein